ncbi:MAG: hypothetical protein KF893_00445 [Caldilineaceae bacterium]|nr:hypothetical protein [Caldilineaceae bacterium]
MQTMLHLQPRIQSIQDQRRARKVQGPDLTQVTQFAALLAEGTLAPDGHVPLHLRKLRAQTPLPPFYLERLLERLDARHQQDLRGDGWMIGSGHRMFGVAGTPLATVDSERRARQLLEAAAPVLQPLNQQIPTFVEYKNGRGEEDTIPARRADVFRTGLSQGIEMARLLDAHLIAPIRHDNLAPGDPFVQTTLYVVAPLFEPLASALIWPTLVHLLNYLGERHISQIVGIFATGSYAGDSNRAIEDAVSFASIAELEALTDLHPAAQSAVEPLVRGEGFPALPGQCGLLESWVGRSLLDRIYLVDREKSNQGLVRNSYELSVLVGNALEAMITTDGNQHVEEQLGIDLRNAHERPYSLMGAAGDYVPLDYIFSAVHQQEEKRLIREVILNAEDPVGNPAQEAEAASLIDLGITQDQVIAQLIAQMPDLFLNVTPHGLDELAIHPNFVLPPSIAAELRPLSPAGWLAAFEDRLQTVTQQFDRLVGASALDYAWGLGALHPNGLPKNKNDKRVLPAAALYMRRTFVELLAESPTGLRQAQSRLAIWQAELEEARQRVTILTPGQRNLATAQRQLALRQWRAHYEGNVLKEPSLGRTLLRSSLLVLAVLIVAIGYLIAFNRPFDLIVDGGTLLGIFLGAYVGGAMSYRRRLTRIQRLRRERLALAQAELTSQLQERVQQGLLRAYDHLAQMLREMARALEDTNESLNQWTVDDGIPTPVAYAATHLYGPRVSDRLWELCRSHLRAQQDREGRRSEERLRSSWRSVAWRRKLEGLLLEEEDRRPLSAAMQDLLRESVQATISDLSAASAQAVRDELVRELAQICNLEHLLWRDGSAPHHTNGAQGTSKQNLIHRYLEALWSHAKPAANYDVADRLAAHGIPVDFAAVWGSAESDLSETTLREFRSTLLPTDDPFRLNFVRTVHGLTLEDLGSIRRYYMEMMMLNDANLDQLALVDRQRRLLYGVEEDASEEARERVRG